MTKTKLALIQATGNLCVFTDESGHSHCKFVTKSPALNYDVHLRVFLPNHCEVALTYDQHCAFVRGAQFYNQEDTYSFYIRELDMTIIAPHGCNIDTDMLMPALQKLRQARSIVDRFMETGNMSSGLSDEEDGLHVYLTINTKNFPMPCTIYEDPCTNTLIFRSCNGQRINDNDPTDTKVFEDHFARLFLAWCHIRSCMKYPFYNYYDFTPELYRWVTSLAD